MGIRLLEAATSISEMERTRREERPFNQEMQYPRSLEVLTQGDPWAHAATVRKVVSEAAPNLAIVDIARLSD